MSAADEREELVRHLKLNVRPDFGPALDKNYQIIADRILALLRPLDGVTLNSQEAITVRTALHKWANDEPERRTRLRALAERIEAAS